jgi:hypothetical protein
LTNWRKFDYVYLLFTEDETPNPDPSHLKLIDEGDRFQLYRVIQSETNVGAPRQRTEAAAAGFALTQPIMPDVRLTNGARQACISRHVFRSRPVTYPLASVRLTEAPISPRSSCVLPGRSGPSARWTAGG